MKICFYGDYFKSYLPTKPDIFCIFFQILGLVTCIRDFRWLIIVSRIKQRFHIADMIWKSKVKVTYT